MKKHKNLNCLKKGTTSFPRNEEHQYQLLAFLCSKLPVEFLKAMNPTLNFLPGNVASLPISSSIIKDGNLRNKTLALVERTKQDWDSYETSWDFTSLPLLNPNFRQPNLKLSYQKLRSHWREMTLETQRLEEENNRIFIEAYGLQDELTPEVPLGEITLTIGRMHMRYAADCAVRLQKIAVQLRVSRRVGRRIDRKSNV